MKLPAIHKKLVRDLWKMRSQAMAISAVVAAGVALFIVLLSTFHSLDLTRRKYYQTFRFADVFVSLTRAPLRIKKEIAAIPGVAQVRDRIAVFARVHLKGFTAPITVKLLSVPPENRAVLNGLFLREGRSVSKSSNSEVLLNDRFATAQGIKPGSSVSITVKGNQKQLRVVGIALSPEYVYTIRPGGLFPDDKRFGIFWMGRQALADLVDMQGAFNDVSLRLAPGANIDAVIHRLDNLLTPYGGLGAQPRSRQRSNFYLQSELQGLEAMGFVLPVVFLGVAAFLLNVVLRRMVTIQRTQIAMLKALGYRNRDIALHYAAWAALISFSGSLFGIGIGAWLGRSMTSMYTEFFNFPVLTYSLPIEIVFEALLISLIAAVFGSLISVRQAVRLPPAEAMRPPLPNRYRSSLAENLGIKRWLSVTTRIIMRNLQRHPGRALLSVAGMAMGGALVVAGSFSLDSIEEIMHLHFDFASRQDATITFVDPIDAQNELMHLSGLITFEPFRAVAVRFRHGPKSREGSLTGLRGGAKLVRVVDSHYRVKHLPPIGLVMSSKLATVLGAQLGDNITVDVLEGRRPVRILPLRMIVKDYVGMAAHLNLKELHRILDEPNLSSGAYLRVDPQKATDLYRRLNGLPEVAAVQIRKNTLESFKQTMAQSMGMIQAVTLIFAMVISFGVIYNSVRIGLSEREHELATLRILGFTPAEISFILLGEFAFLSVIAIPIGLTLGYGLSALVVEAYNTEMFRLPLTVFPKTYAVAGAAQLAAAFLSGIVVWKKLHHLNLVEVLKQR